MEEIVGLGGVLGGGGPNNFSFGIKFGLDGEPSPEARVHRGDLPQRFGIFRGEILLENIFESPLRIF